jgi:hypothetical protein
MAYTIQRQMGRHNRRRASQPLKVISSLDIVVEMKHAKRTCPVGTREVDDLKERKRGFPLTPELGLFPKTTHPCLIIMQPSYSSQVLIASSTWAVDGNNNTNPSC